MSDDIISKTEKVDIIRPGDIPSSEESAETPEETRFANSSSRYYMKMQYKENQFLRAQDFKDEQQYHARKLIDHNRTLHVYGICGDGLRITKSRHFGCVDVSKGSAIDPLGRSILLDETETLDLYGLCKTSTATETTWLSPVLLYISYDEADAADYIVEEGGFKGCTRTLEKPAFHLCPDNSLPDEDRNMLFLAIIHRDTASGAIGTINDQPTATEDVDPRRRRLRAGVALGELQPNSVREIHLMNGSVTADKLAANAVTTAKIENLAITGAKIANGAVNIAQLADGAVTADKLAANAVTNAKINNGAVNADKLATDAVTTAKIQNNAVNADKLAANAVTNAKINNGAVNADKLATDAVTTVKIQNSAVTADKLATNSVTTDKINNGAVTGAKIADTTITNAKIANTTITGGKIANSTITGGKLANQAIDYAQMNFVTRETSLSVSKNSSTYWLIGSYSDLNDPARFMPIYVQVMPNSGDSLVKWTHACGRASNLDCYGYLEIQNMKSTAVTVWVHITYFSSFPGKFY